LLNTVQKDASLAAPEQAVLLQAEPGLSLNGWPTMIERAVDNLLRNAQRFNPAGEPIELQRGARRRTHSPSSVRDHGPGVAEEYLAQLGEPFFRAPGQTAAGHGLGLAIARRAAERHGGRLLLGNHPQGGFVATLELPLEPNGNL
jgi:two-component system, OmpR family, sensor kinase